MHQMPSGDPLGADQVRVPRPRASHRLPESDHAPEPANWSTSGWSTGGWDARGWQAGAEDPAGRATGSHSATDPYSTTGSHSAIDYEDTGRVTISPELPIGAGPYPPRPDPWTVGSGSWPVRAEGWTTGSIPVIPADPPQRPAWLRPAQAGGVAAGWLLMIVLSAAIGPADGIRTVALYLHLVFLTIGFGAVLAIGLNGVALMLRWVRVSRVVMLAVTLDPLIWLGLAGLCLSGLVLAPDLDRGWTWVKLLAVLVVAINALWHRDVMAELGRLPSKAGRRSISPWLLRRAVRVSATSQFGWWIAVTIGFVATNG